MIVVDTSVWIDAFRDRDGLAANMLGRLLEDDLVALTGPSRLELLLGARRRDEPRLRRLFSALPCWFPERGTWRLAESWIQPALRAGQRFGFADLLIGAIARENEASIWSADSDFERMASLGLVTEYLPGS